MTAAAFLIASTVFQSTEKGFLKFARRVKAGGGLNPVDLPKINYLRGKKQCLQINYRRRLYANSRRQIHRFSLTALSLRAAR